MEFDATNQFKATEAEDIYVNWLREINALYVSSVALPCLQLLDT